MYFLIFQCRTIMKTFMIIKQIFFSILLNLSWSKANRKLWAPRVVKPAHLFGLGLFTVLDASPSTNIIGLPGNRTPVGLRAVRSRWSFPNNCYLFIYFNTKTVENTIDKCNWNTSYHRWTVVNARRRVVGVTRYGLSRDVFRNLTCPRTTPKCRSTLRSVTWKGRFFHIKWRAK